ncbi:MAG: DUF342 domain-containing protein [Oscillospiraceae bacterium]|nr:DUF342 domain-containing protein [Oscillospiraceae bacterium]
MGDNENGKRKSFLWGLFEKTRSGANEIEEDVVQQQTQPVVSSEAVKESAEEEEIFIEAKGAFLDAWKRWQPGEYPRFLSLSGNGHGCAIPLGTRELGLERIRLGAKIERDARDYLNKLKMVDDYKLRMEAKEALKAAGQGKEESTETKEPEVKTKCCTYISANGMLAWMLLFPPTNPEETLEMGTIVAAMQECGITTGIDSGVLAYVFREKPYFTLIPCACGTPVQEGENGRVIENYARQLTKSVKLDERGVADYRAMNYMQLIKEGDVICEIIPPKPGAAGMRVDGVVVEPPPIKAAVVPAGKNTCLNEEGTQLLAEKDGHLEFDGSKFSVKLILEIPGDVDYNTGNIDYHGDVHVHGDVRATFSIKATGNVIVDGLVEAATVEAGGDVLISCGVLGDNNALIKSGGNIRAKYLENCVAYAGKSVFADCVITCQVYSDESIQITSGRGTIIGGTLVAAHSIKSRMVGTESGRKTEIELGELTYVKMGRMNDAAELKSAMSELAALERDISYLEKRQGMEGANPRLASAQLRKSAVCEKIEFLTHRQEELDRLRPDLGKCRFECATVYPPTMLTIGGAVWKFSEVKRNCVGRFDKETGEVKIS